MQSSRQVAFQTLRPPCVELSGIALKFRGSQATSKAVLQALEKLYQTLKPLGQSNALDEKLAEYAFFPLSTCFNESKRLSSRCLEVSVRCLQVLVAHGWKQKLSAATGKQLLILLIWLAGGGPGQEQRLSPSEELITAAFECMSDIVVQLDEGANAAEVLNEIGVVTVVDQITYLLLQAIEESSVEGVQIAALTSLRTLWLHISSRSVLASILPRTISALTKGLRSTTKARKTAKVVVTNLETLTTVIRLLFNDESAVEYTGIASRSAPVSESAEEIVLDEKWFNATIEQIKIALAQIVQLRTHDRSEVRQTLGRLCITVLEDCHTSLSNSMNLMIDTLVVICSNDDEVTQSLLPIFNHIIGSNSSISEYLKSSLYSWSQSLPRIMQGNDDRPKQRLLRQVSFTFGLISKFDDTSDILDDTMVNTLIESVTAALRPTKVKNIQSVPETDATSIQLLNINSHATETSFPPIVLEQQSQQASSSELQALVARLQSNDAAQSLVATLVHRVSSASLDSLLSPLWLSLLFLQSNSITDTSMEAFIDLPDLSITNSRPYLVEELYSSTTKYLEYDGHDQSFDWRNTALSLEVICLQASQLGQSFRTELIDILYPMLALLGIPHAKLREHTIIALNRLAGHLEYSSVADMLIENVDYLINSVALKLNTFDLSPQGPKVMLMMLRLCGASIVPYLDDLITALFTALDNFHGYPRLVEVIFQVLNAVVEESSKSALSVLAIEGPIPEHKKARIQPSTVDDILFDLRARKKRKTRSNSDTDPLQAHPKRPWTSRMDGEDVSKVNEDEADMDSEQPIEDESSEPLPQSNEPTKQLSKPHNLLLSIARSTIPHISSPSAEVRLTCLNLLNQVIPLLARDENSFLPVVNDIWDAVVARLFSSSSNQIESDIESEEGDAQYNQIAASKIIASLCKGAGDFMSTRIEDIFPRLEKMYRDVWKSIEADRRRLSHRSTEQQQRKKLTWNNDAKEKTIEIRTRTTPATSSGSLAMSRTADQGEDGRGIEGISNISKSSDDRLTSKGGDLLSPISTKILSPTPSNSSSRTQDIGKELSSGPIYSQTQKVHIALMELFTSILSYVRIPDEMGNRILTLASPALFGEYSVLSRKHPIIVGTIDGSQEQKAAKEMLEALEIWNADAVWLVRLGFK